MSGNSRYYMRRTTRRSSAEMEARNVYAASVASRRSGRHTPAESLFAVPSPGGRLGQGNQETRIGLGARGSPATNRSTAYGGRSMELPGGLSAQAVRAPIGSLIDAAVASSRHTTGPVAKSVAGSEVATATTSNDSVSDAHTDESPLAEEGEPDTPTSSDRDNAQRRHRREQLLERRRCRQIEAAARVARPSFFSRLSSVVTGTAKVLFPALASFWKYVCILLVSLFLLSSVQRTFAPSLSATLPNVDLNRITGLLGLAPSHDWVRNENPWQYQTVSRRLNVLEGKMETIWARINGEEPVRRLNFFASASGVLVDPYLTSPTRPFNYGTNHKREVGRGLLDWIFDRPSSLLPHRGFGPSSVFRPWDDAGECWCAPPSGGKSQIAVVLPQPMIPQELLVEHIPQTATFDHGAMPKDLEFWVQVEDPQARALVDSMARDAVLAGSDASSATDDYGTKKALDDSWVRIGAFTFEKEAGYSAQTFHMPVDLRAANSPVSKVVVRATASWGADSSVCIYRLKLHGLKAERVVEEEAGQVQDAVA